MAQPPGDKIDRDIIRALRANSRESFVDLGKKMGLSESAIRRRVRNLLDAKVISRFTIEMGESNQTSAIVLASLDSATDNSKVAARLAKMEEVQIVYEITGQYDIAAVISASNMADINGAIDALRKIRGVTDTNTVIILNKIT
ncbi:MAG: Lrp/AsnC family transcriptional regulator [Nitrosopumilaceae archaeon]|nr:Lrp/AsnC family transcriptional regulator [Nitrosopumilaceae archaeon]